MVAKKIQYIHTYKYKAVQQTRKKSKEKKQKYEPADTLLYIPFIQRQVNRPRSSRHVPSFWHGFDAHSSMFVSHLSPVYPGTQSHTNDPGVLTHVPPCSQGGRQPASDVTSQHAVTSFGRGCVFFYRSSVYTDTSNSLRPCPVSERLAKQKFSHWGCPVNSNKAEIFCLVA